MIAGQRSRDRLRTHSRGQDRPLDAYELRLQGLFLGFELQEDLITLLIIVTLIDKCFHLGM